MESIISYPERGKWGDSKYRGNTSGHVIKDLLLQFFPDRSPRKFVEVFSGGGTGKDVAVDLGIKDSVHLDFNTGWNAIRDEIPFGSDFVFSHPPYWDIISYQRYNDNNPDDLSIMGYDEFIKNLDMINAKIYQSLLNGGRHAFLIGDIRKRGKYYSIIKDMSWFGDLESHIIKTQHNTMSGNKNYARRNFIPIAHEHLLVFKKNKVWAVQLKQTVTRTFDLRQFKNITWRDLVQGAVEFLGGKATLSDIYEVIKGSKRTATNSNWKAKIRQVLQLTDNFVNVERGVWSLAY